MNKTNTTNTTKTINKYQNVTYKELINYSENNPNRTRTLDSIEIRIQETSLDNLGLKGYNAFNLNPTGIISLMACINDVDHYQLASISARTQLIIDLATKLQEKTEELKNTSISRKRKKLSELIAAAYNGSSKEKDYCELFHGLSIMCDIQFVLVKSAVQEEIEEGKQGSLKGEILFATDPSNWKLDTPIWIVDYHSRWVALNDTTDTHKIIADWLTSIEYTGWIIKWPEMGETKTEMIEKLSQMGLWQETDRKLTKDILSVRLGRTSCIRVFTKWI